MEALPNTKVYNVTNDQKKTLTYGTFLNIYSRGQAKSLKHNLLSHAGRIAEQVEIAFYTEPAVSSLWLPKGNTTNIALLELIYMIIYHIIPGLWFDLYFMVSGSHLR